MSERRLLNVLRCANNLIIEKWVEKFIFPFLTLERCAKAYKAYFPLANKCFTITQCENKISRENYDNERRNGISVLKAGEIKKNSKRTKLNELIRKKINYEWKFLSVECCRVEKININHNNTRKREREMTKVGYVWTFWYLGNYDKWQKWERKWCEKLKLWIFHYWINFSLRRILSRRIRRYYCEPQINYGLIVSFIAIVFRLARIIHFNIPTSAQSIRHSAPLARIHNLIRTLRCWKNN